MRSLISCFFISYFFSCWPVWAQERFQVIPNPEEKQIDIFVGGKLFTSYIYKDSLLKPVLYPILAPNGSAVTRHYPFKKVSGEWTDHPAHAGLWMGFGSVNGVDFWDVHPGLPAETLQKKGRIRHARLLQVKSGAEACGLEVSATWETMDGLPLMLQHTRYIFREKDNIRTIDIITTFTALEEQVKLLDNANGLLGIRLSNDMLKEHGGRVTSSEKFVNDAISGTEARWVQWASKLGSEPVTLLLFDHPLNIGYPSYWNVLDTGLLAVNPWGVAVYTRGAQSLSLQLPPSASATYRYRLMLVSKTPVSPAQVQAEYEAFTKLK
jgi:hypothetical protein